MSISAVNNTAYKTALAVGTLYRVGRIRGEKNVGPQGVPNLWINSGTVSVYGSNSVTTPTALSQMTLNAENTGVSGVVEFNLVPTFIAITQASGTTTELIAYGLVVESLGAIS